MINQWMTPIQELLAEGALADFSKRRQFVLALAERLRSDQSVLLMALQADLDRLPTEDHLHDLLILSPELLTDWSDCLVALANSGDPLAGGSRAGLGVLAIIGDKTRLRPLVDWPVLGLFSGNGVLIKGAKQTDHFLTALVALFRDCLAGADLSPELLVYTGTERKVQQALLKSPSEIALVMGTGGAEQEQILAKHATVPLFSHGQGVNTLFVDTSADLALAVDGLMDARLNAQKPLHTVLLHENLPQPFIDELLGLMDACELDLFTDSESLDRLAASQRIFVADPEAWSLPLEETHLLLKVVSNSEAALAHLNQFSDGLLDGVVSTDSEVIRYFRDQAKSAEVCVNGSLNEVTGYASGFGVDAGIGRIGSDFSGLVGPEAFTRIR